MVFRNLRVFEVARWVINDLRETAHLVSLTACQCHCDSRTGCGDRDKWGCGAARMKVTFTLTVTERGPTGLSMLTLKAFAIPTNLYGIFQRFSGPFRRASNVRLILGSWSEKDYPRVMTMGKSFLCDLVYL